MRPCINLVRPPSHHPDKGGLPNLRFEFQPLQGPLGRLPLPVRFEELWVCIEGYVGPLNIINMRPPGQDAY